MNRKELMDNVTSTCATAEASLRFNCNIDFFSLKGT